MTFEDLGLSTRLLDALKEKNYSTPTPIQLQAIPLVLQQNDILGSAQTGTGKTAAFALPIIEMIQGGRTKIDSTRKIQSLILSPTRELATQIGDNIHLYSKFTNVNHAVIYGGVKQKRQVNLLKKGVDILVATPGRLLDLIQQGHINLSHVKSFVLDEADRMLDMGFIHDIKRLINHLPDNRQTLFFSATMPRNIVELSDSLLTDPSHIAVEPTSKSTDTIKQYVYYTDQSKKRDLLKHVIDFHTIDQALIFVRTKHGADKLSTFLNKSGYKTDSIHGDKRQNYRQKALRAFKNNSVQFLVGTDVASRGIDIDKLPFVINYDMPEDTETYVHRIGRSGRAGEVGNAITFSQPEQNRQIREIEKDLKLSIKPITDQPFPQKEVPMPEKQQQKLNGNGSGRNRKKWNRNKKYNTSKKRRSRA